MDDLTSYYPPLLAGGPIKQSPERSIKCFCCRDAAIIPENIVKKYLFPNYEPFRAYPNRPDAPVLCTRHLCDANDTLVEKEGRQIPVKRFAEQYLDTRIKPEHCEMIHQMELAEWQQSSQEPIALSSMVQQIVANRTIKTSPWDKVAKTLGMSGGDSDG